MCLAKYVLSSYPVYAMKALWLPESTCDFIDKKVRSCIWAKDGQSRGWNLVPWGDVSCPKAEGGLGFHSARRNNVALLGKLVDNLLHDHNKVWVRALTEKYVPDKLILHGEYSQGDSYIWKGIIRAKNDIKDGFQPLLGNGGSSFWYDDWLGSGKLCNRVSFIHISDTTLSVADLWLNGAWHLQALYT